MLFAILLFSCDQNNVCIDADDFGDVERETIKVYAGGDEKLDKCSVPDSAVASGYRVLPEGALKTCLTIDTNLIEPKLSAQSETAIQFSLVSSSDRAKDSATPAVELPGCLKFNTTNASNALRLCELYCELKCSNNEVYASATALTPMTTSVGSIFVESNNPRSTNSDTGINITPGSKIFITAKGSVSNASPAPTVIDGSKTIRSLITPDAEFHDPAIAPQKIKIESENPYNFKLNGNIEYPAGTFLFNSNVFPSDPAGIRNKAIQTKIFARRNLIILNQYPEGYSATRTPLKADPEAWKCLEGFPNQSKNIDCSIHANANYDQYHSVLTPFENEYSSEVFDVGTESMKIIGDGGFIRYNGDLLTPEISEDPSVTEFQGVVYKKIIIGPSTTSISALTLDGVGEDRFIDLKTDCKSLTLSSLSIKKRDDATKTYYQIDNLTLSSSYTTKNIPLYSDSTININISPAVASSCNLFIKAQKYLDIVMPNSGFVEFRMKDLEAISYDDLEGKGVYDKTNDGTKKNIICPTGSFVTKISANRDGFGRVVGIGVGCGPTGALVNVTGSAEFYIGAQSSSSNPVNLNSLGFSKIKIVKDSSGIKNITFSVFGLYIGYSMGTDACILGVNCVHVSCNGGKISGLKAQADSSSIKALSVICSGNNDDPATSNENVCTIYGRILNPSAEKTPASGAGIVVDSSSDYSKIYSRLQFEDFSTIPLATQKINQVYLGLPGYASADKKYLTDSECKIPLNISSCMVDGNSCNLEKSQIAEHEVSGCHTGDGLNGIITSGKGGTGGGGGGNNSKQTRIPNGYAAGSDSAEAGKNGESYINPEFDFNDVTNFVYNPGELSGIGASSPSQNGLNGFIELSDSNGGLITTFDYFHYTFPAGQTTIKYKIRGAGGGAGGNCLVLNGGAGSDGDSFRGTLDFSTYLSAVYPTRTLSFQRRIGNGGYSGKNCLTAIDSNSSQNKNNSSIKGGNGGLDDNGPGDGGAGGSASSISFLRGDEIGDYRVDYLVIAGGGGGGGGAVSNISGSSSKDIPYKRSGKLNASKFVTYRLGVSVSGLASVATPSDYYEYDDFFSKNVSGPAPALTSKDPTKKIIVKTSGYSTDLVFVRKGQILRILPKSFENLWNSKEGPKECGVGMVMKITPRPAALCLKGIQETITNLNCAPDVAGEVVSIVSGSPTLATQSAPVVTGCKIVSTCTNPFVPNYFCPINTDDCLKINCSGAGSIDSPKTGCVFQNIVVGTACPLASCAGNPLVTSYNSAIDPDYDCANTLTTCEACRQKRMQEILESPQITIPENEAYKCYNFESYKKSVNNFLTNYNSQATSALKSGLISSDSDIKVISDYENNYGFGNFENHKPIDQLGNLDLINPVKFINLGTISQLIVTNNNFNNFDSDIMGNILPLSSGSALLNIGAKTTRTLVRSSVMSGNAPTIFANGDKLIVSLCKENAKDGVLCKTENGTALVVSPGATTPKSLGLYVGNASAGDNKFAFDSKGILRRVSLDAVGTASNCDGVTINDNFICFKNDLGNAGEIEKYRLSFAIDTKGGDIKNEKGSYDVKIEKRNPTSTRSGGIVDSILRPIITNLDGAKTNDPATPADESKGIAENFYVKLINHPLYRNILTLVMVLSFSFYGMGYLMGINEFKNSEIVKILLKVGFIYLFTSTTSGWVWFEKFFVEFFKNAVDFITFSVAETFDSVNSGEYRAKIIASDYYDKGILFKSVDKVVDLILSAVVQKKILALLFSSIFGWIYFLLLYHCLLAYVYAIANAMLLYITCQIVVSILFVLGPIFFVFLMFKVTKEMFDNWIKALIGFSLQQIFLIMTLSLFNTFVIAFLKLSLGYRICWANVLSINLLYTKISLLNFWIVAGTNSPEAGMEDVPEDSFGSDSNMPSLYLFLYLLTTVSLMKKFIELFTNLAVTLSGGLKAATLSADAASAAKGLAKQVGSKVSSAYNATIGRVVSNVDNLVFDSGSIADSRRAEERKNFATDMKTKATLVTQGNEAISNYKKEHALEFSKMNSSEQKQKLESVRDKAMSKYASDNGISEKKLDQLKNSSGINYTGNNLFGALAQAGNQAVFSGGSLFNPIANKKVDTSFSKAEANAALKKMDGAGGEEKRNEFIRNVEDGNVKVNKGKIENARKVVISAVPRIVSAALNPKATVQSALKVATSPVSNALSSNKVKSEVIANLEKSGKISTINSSAPSFLKNWARSDEDKKIIRDKTREVVNERENSFGKKQGNQTSRSVIKDLKLTNDYVKKTEDNSGQDFSKTSEGSFMAKLGRFGGRAKNAIPLPFLNSPNLQPKENTKTQIVPPQTREELEKKKSQENIGLDVLKGRDKNVSEKIKTDHKDFYHLDKMKDSLKENKEASNDSKSREEIKNEGSPNVKKALEDIDKLSNTSKKLEKIDELMQKEFTGNKASDLIALVDNRKEVRAEIVEKELNLKTLDHKVKVVELSEKANQIKAKCDEDINEYKQNRNVNSALATARKINVFKAIPRAVNMVAEGAVRGYRTIVNSPRNFITGGKDKNPNSISASAPVPKIPLPKPFPIVQKEKKARKALKKFEKIKSTKDLERFVKKFEHMVSTTNDKGPPT